MLRLVAETRRFVSLSVNGSLRSRLRARGTEPIREQLCRLLVVASEESVDHLPEGIFDLGIVEPFTDVELFAELFSHIVVARRTPSTTMFSRMLSTST